MAFEPNKILQEHIIDAVKKIEDKKLKLIPSTGYDVIIDGKRYPPKEIIRISHQIAVGTEAGIIYGGEPVNRILRNLGFTVEQKITLWKLGCNWGSGTPSFYEFIKKEGIVIGVKKFDYQVGDLVLITEGFTVFAIAKVLEQLKPVTSNKDFQNSFDELEIEYSESIFYANAEWYELPKTDIFKYELQQGIVRVQKLEIKERAINIWENRGFRLSEILFYVRNFRTPVNLSWNYPCLVLTKHSWDDYGYRTSHSLEYFKSSEDKVEIGDTKILDIDSKETIIHSSFTKLDTSKYCSLGVTREYYKRLKTEFPETYLQILKALNDCAFFEETKKQFENYEGFKISLLRSTEAELILQEQRDLIENVTKRKRKYSFTFEHQIDGALVPHKVSFDFNEEDSLFNRFFCIIGKNGTGKTKIISQLANKLTDTNEDGQFYPARPDFAKTITASFSYFDRFKFPEKQDKSYEFIGIKSLSGILDEASISSFVWNAYKKISEEKSKRSLWVKSIENSMESEYLNFNLNEIKFISSRKEFIEKTEDIFSSGQKIIFQFITRLIAAIEDNSILIFDEPETHLHPNIAGRLLRTIKNILTEFNSFCILSTHSPIIVQEIPSKNICVFDRKGNFPIMSKPSIECFGENLSNISNAIFHVSQEDELYKETIDQLINNGKTLNEVELIFNGNLSLNARLYIQSKISL